MSEESALKTMEENERAEREARLALLNAAKHIAKSSIESCNPAALDAATNAYRAATGL